jgi:hypothetical protein
MQEKITTFCELCVSIIILELLNCLSKQKTNSVAFSPQADYTDWSTAAGGRILVQTFTDGEVSRGRRGETSTADYLGFWDRSRFFFFQVAPQLSSWGWVDPVPEPLLPTTSRSAGNPTRDLCICSQELWSLHHRRARGHNGRGDILGILYAAQSCSGPLWQPSNFTLLFHVNTL